MEKYQAIGGNVHKYGINSHGGTMEANILVVKFISLDMQSRVPPCNVLRKEVDMKPRNRWLTLQ